MCGNHAYIKVRVREITLVSFEDILTLYFVSQGKLPSISDMQGFLKIAIPDELRDTIVWRTLPVRPNMNTRDVCE